MQRIHGIIEFHSLASLMTKKGNPPFMQRALELVFQRAQFREQLPYLVAH
jgi:hypothetical protein